MEHRNTGKVTSPNHYQSTNSPQTLNNAGIANNIVSEKDIQKLER